MTLRTIDDEKIARAKGCILGQFAGDALGSLVEFMSPEKIKELYPRGVKNMTDGGAWGTQAGQPTDDSEMAMMLARSLVDNKIYNIQDVKSRYLYWLNTDPFDIGNTTYAGLTGNPIKESQSNGSLMRISPLGIFGANYPDEKVIEWAGMDAKLTHINNVSVEATMLFAATIAYSIRNKSSAKDTYFAAKGFAIDIDVDKLIMNALIKSKFSKPNTYMINQGWVLIALQNAFYQLLHTKSLEEGIVNTIMEGGDTDTNAAICGALLGSVYGIDNAPRQWIEKITSCEMTRNSLKPRPKAFWPTDIFDIATQLVV